METRGQSLVCQDTVVTIGAGLCSPATGPLGFEDPCRVCLQLSIIDIAAVQLQESGPSQMNPSPNPLEAHQTLRTSTLHNKHQ